MSNFFKTNFRKKDRFNPEQMILLDERFFYWISSEYTANVS